MPKLADLPKSEMEVAQVVWRLKAARVRDVVAELTAAGKKADFWTVQTYLRRLKAKGYLTARREGRAMVYAPAVTPARVVRDVVTDFVGRLFGGQALPLVQHLIDDADLSDADIDHLQKSLDDLKRRRRP
jgi:BlaI family penicillinase repressor